MDHDEKLAALRLIRTANIGPMTYGLLVRRYGSAREALRAVPDLAKRGGRKLQPASPGQAQAEWDANIALGATLLFRDGDGYPPRLAQFEDAPPVLSVRGNLHLLQRPMIAMVGARNASINAQRLAEKFAGELSEAGYVIVSGLARGIDTAAHNGSLAGGTAAVIAGGIDMIYPPENADLFEEIAVKGVILAEMPPGTNPTPRHFPIRNRIIAGLSVGVVVVEAAARSGSLITAREASERGCDVMAVPGSPLDPRSEGCNRLIRDGAILVQGTEDIIASISPPAHPTAPPAWTPPPMAPATGSEQDISDARTAILAGLSAEPTDIDEIVRWCDTSPANIHAAILELEVAGQVLRHHGNRISKRLIT